MTLWYRSDTDDDSDFGSTASGDRFSDSAAKDGQRPRHLLLCLFDAFV